MTQQKQKHLGRACRPLLRCAARELSYCTFRRLPRNRKAYEKRVQLILKRRVRVRAIGEEERRGYGVESTRKHDARAALRCVTRTAIARDGTARRGAARQGRARNEKVRTVDNWRGEKREGGRMSTTTQDRTRKEIERNGLEQNEDTDAT